jgi:hypothetical protein
MWEKYVCIQLKIDPRDGKKTTIAASSFCHKYIEYLILQIVICKD